MRFSSLIIFCNIKIALFGGIVFQVEKFKELITFDPVVSSKKITVVKTCHEPEYKVYFKRKKSCERLSSFLHSGYHLLAVIQEYHSAVWNSETPNCLYGHWVIEKRTFQQQEKLQKQCDNFILFAFRYEQLLLLDNWFVSWKRMCVLFWNISVSYISRIENDKMVRHSKQSICLFAMLD